MSQDHFDQIIEHLHSVWPEEGCGLLAGTADVTHRVLPITNILHSHNRFRMDPEQQVTSMLAIREAGMQLVGIFHSHPHGPSQPSTIDMLEAAYPEAAYLVFWFETEKWNATAYSIQDGGLAEMELVIT
jgi:proteasome lid subunit RPN8/RPN11